MEWNSGRRTGTYGSCRDRKNDRSIRRRVFPPKCTYCFCFTYAETQKHSSIATRFIKCLPE